MATHLDQFNELVVAVEAVGEQMDEARQLIILLGSLVAEYDMLVSIIENTASPQLLDVTEMLLKAEEKSKVKEEKEVAFKARTFSTKGHQETRKQGGAAAQINRQLGGFSGKCFKCGRVGYKAATCTRRTYRAEDEVLTFVAADGATDGWLLDSGASSHMSLSRDDFVAVQPLDAQVTVKVANGSLVNAAGVRDIALALENGRRATVKDVLYIPGFDRRLLSVSNMTARGLRVEFGKSVCVIKRGNKVVVTAAKVGNIYKSRFEAAIAMAVEHAAPVTEWLLWHARLGHRSYERARQTLGVATGLSANFAELPTVCSGCACGKMKVASFPKAISSAKSTRVLELGHADVMGPMSCQSQGEARYVLLFVDDYSRFVVIYFLKKKSEVVTQFVEYKAVMKAQTGKRVMKIRTDNGSEFVNKAFDNTCVVSGIVH